MSFLEGYLTGSGIFLAVNFTMIMIYGIFKDIRRNR